MKNNYFNSLQKDVKSGKLTKQEGVEKIAIHIQNNYKLFGLDAYDEDFRSNITLEFLQKGHSIFDRFDETYGNFFAYLYSFIKGLVLTELKSRAKQKVNDKVDLVQSLEHFFEMEEKNDFTLVVEDSMCVPYAPKTFSKPEFEKTVKEFMAKRQYKKLSKSIVILALKACYDIKDDEIDLICREFKLDKDDFHRTIQSLKENLENKKQKRNTVIKTRNNAFYQHMRYRGDFSGHLVSTDYIKREYETKFKINTKRWKETNHKLSKGVYHLTPSNQDIAEILGISERQVCYYITTFRSDLEEIKSKNIFNNYLLDDSDEFETD